MRGQVGLASVLLVAAARAAHADPQPLTDVFFRFDSAELSREGKLALDAAAQQAIANPGAKVVIEGHADPIGTSPYNVGLSIRRAESARDYLLSAGIERDSIVLAYYGEDGAPRPTYAQRRRVTVELTRQPLYVVIDRALPVATALTWEKPATVAEIEGPRAELSARR